MTIRARCQSVAVALTTAAAVALAGCGGEPPPPQPTSLPPSTVVPATAEPATPEATATTAVTTTIPTESQLPADGEAVVVQLARIDHSPWEPALLAQMTPHFSLQANGRIVFSHPGPDPSGWYQSVIPPEDVRRFVRVFADEIDLFGLVERHSAGPVRFGVNADGSPNGCKATGIIFVRTEGREARLVMSECEINAPSGPDTGRINRLKEVVNMVQHWKEGVNGPVDPNRQAGITALLGWWTDTRVPFVPLSSVAFVTKAPAFAPKDRAVAPVAAWPLDQTITDTLRADYGARPGELLLGEAETGALLATARAEFGTPYGPREWGPLFDDGQHVQLVGIRPAVPGANEVVIEPYIYHAPPSDYRLAAR